MYVVSATYRMYVFMQIRFDWPDDKLALYDSIFGQAYLPGAAIGSILTGWLLGKGRRICMYLCTISAIMGIGI